MQSYALRMPRGRFLDPRMQWFKESFVTILQDCMTAQTLEICGHDLHVEFSLRKPCPNSQSHFCD